MQIDAVWKQLNTVQHNLSETINELSSTRSVVQEKSKEIESQKQALDESKEAIKSKDEKLECLQDQLSQEKSQTGEMIDQLKQQICKIEEDNAIKVSQMDVSDQKVTKLNSEIDHYKQSIEDITMSSENTIKELKIILEKKEQSWSSEVC